jgi:trehalose-6-phosphatase
MEQLIPNKAPWIQPNAVMSRTLLLEVKSELEKSLSEQTQVILEDHQLILCLHWHLTPLEDREKVHSCIKILKEKYSGLLFKTLPTSYEVWPSLQWDKSNGLIQMAVLTGLDLDKVLILYIGDSDSDEPAFKWVNKQQGITVRVGLSSQSSAQFKINSQKEVEDILKMLITRI